MKPKGTLSHISMDECIIYIPQATLIIPFSLEKGRQMKISSAFLVSIFLFLYDIGLKRADKQTNELYYTKTNYLGCAPTC